MLAALARAVDILAVVLFAAASLAFAFGLFALGHQEDFRALYLLIVGGLSLRASTELLRPKGGTG
jgi:hypothetical protein